MVLPAQNLARDIVGEIYKHFSTPMIIPILGSDHEDRKGLKPFPWYLGHICSSWRTAFFSMYSEFWSTITINARHRYPNSAWEEAVSVMKVFLEHTKGRPFSFSVDAKHPCPPILDLFIAESTRWNRVSLCLHHDDENISLLRSIQHKIPLLCSLAVKIKLGMPRYLPLIFEDAPTLTHLSFIHLGNWRMDWSSLTELELSRELNVGRLLHVLSQAINLERLGFNRLIINPEELSKKRFEPVTLPRLRTLEISGFAILRFLTTPALQGLYIHKSREYGLLEEPCASFFTRSLCKLQRFGAIRFWPHDFVKILPYMPDLDVLTVCDPVSIGRGWVRVLACRTGEQPSVPQLRVLRLSERCWDVDGVKNVLESRKFLHSVQELKAIIMTWREWDEDDKREFYHPNLQSRLEETDDFYYVISAQFQWLCDDLDC